MKLKDQLDKYFKEINEKVDNIDDKEADMDFEDLPDKDIDNDGDTDDSDRYLHKRLGTVAKKTEGHIYGHDDVDSELKEETAEEKRKNFYDSLSPAEKRRFQRKPYEFGPFYDDEVNEGDIDEMSTTAGVPGYQTPMAFQSKPKSAKDKEKEDDTVMQGGMKKAKKTNKYFKPMENKSTYKKMMAEMYGVVNEVSYRDYKKDPTSTPQQKVNRGIMEVNKMLAEMEKIVANNLRLKTEMGVQSNHFWKATGKRFSKINERMIRIANRLKELSQ